MLQKSLADLSPERRRLLLLLEEAIGFSFKKVEFLNWALSHTSFANESGCRSNERLEFLGDSILELVISHYLFEAYPDKNEGDLSKMKAMVVSEVSLAESATKLQVANYLLMGKGEEKSGGRQKKAILADTMEAVFAAVYLDQGLELARKVILKQLENQIQSLGADKGISDYKSVLGEYCQKKFKKVPIYNLLNEEGPDHCKTFFVEVVVNGKVTAKGRGHTKKEAEQMAAQLVYNTMVAI